MSRPRKEEPKFGDMTWRDMQAFGALSTLYHVLKVKPGRKKKPPEQPKGPGPSGNEPEEKPGDRPRPSDELGKEGEGGENVPPEDLRKILQALEEKEKNTKHPVTMDGRYKDPTWTRLDGLPGRLLNADKPDILPMVRWNSKGKNMMRCKDDKGDVPEHWHRLFEDGKIFSGCPIRGGESIGRGTVLVDMSGSMSWTDESLRELFDNLPDGTAYGYGGAGYGCAGVPGSGRWAMIADRGKCVPPDAVQTWRGFAGYDNMVDLPCLEELAHLPKPRIWISDCQVTGPWGFCEYLRARCIEWCKKNDIDIIRHSNKMRDYFRHGETFDPYVGRGYRRR